MDFLTNTSVSSFFTVSPKLIHQVRPGTFVPPSLTQNGSITHHHKSSEISPALISILTTSIYHFRGLPSTKTPLLSILLTTYHLPYVVHDLKLFSTLRLSNNLFTHILLTSSFFSLPIHLHCSYFSTNPDQFKLRFAILTSELRQVLFYRIFVLTTLDPPPPPVFTRAFRAPRILLSFLARLSS